MTMENLIESNNPQGIKFENETDMQFVKRLIGLMEKDQISYNPVAKRVIENGEKSLKDKAAREKLIEATKKYFEFK